MDSYKEIWNHVLSYIRDNADFSPATYSIWFKELMLEGMTDSTVYLSAKEYYKAEFVFKMYYSQLENAVYQILGSRADIILFTRDLHKDKIQEYIAQHIEKGSLPEKVLSKNPQSAAFKAEQPLFPEEKEKIEEPKGTLITSEIPPVKKNDDIIEEYTFENFIPGQANKFAYEACKAFADNPNSDRLLNPLFIYGPPGVGKTHLLYAISNSILSRKKAKAVLYTKGSDFCNDLISDIMLKKPMHYFREKYRMIDILLIDDIQFIGGKNAVQEEFFHTFNALYELGKKLVLVSDRPPKDIKLLAGRLADRFSAGLMIDIQPPELELRIAILTKKSKQAGLNIPNNIITYLANNVKSSVRQLEGLVKKMHAASFIYNQPIDMDFAKRCIAELTPTVSVDETVEKTFDKVCEKYQVTVKDITGKRRQANIVIARHVATYILRQITDLSSIEIARYFSQDHSSILSAIKNVEKKIEDDPSLENTISGLISEIKE